MTDVVIDLDQDTSTGLAGARGSIGFYPTRRRREDDTIVVPASFRVAIPDASSVTVPLPPTGPGWCWRFTEHLIGARGTTRHVLVPDSTDPVQYADLIDVDPATLDPAAEPEAAWWAALEQGAYGVAATVDPDDADVLLLRFPVWRRDPDDETALLMPILTQTGA